ncbi:patatin-like phospholipase family protein [Pontixanthobacter aquaemixtae]|uniref:PNPLA domain-containing protein n=1 Tax=Pontixanthobacter aquaemixtae TaxID=1958940 RepID=A0A844ZS09_9SPHN|nr:patatin-like phospholipase family protein [Pontixanthobacter aquaemixtae]MXO90653.1 hypothetical protein [Pontixanthobacter aquaemixtae]
MYAIFQGGGARGIAHVGAIAALETDDIEFAGVGGSSAGAIVAALKAVGYSSTDMFNCEDGSNILSRIDLNHGKVTSAIKPATGPRDLFGGVGWFAIMAAKFLWRYRMWVISLWAGLWVALLIASHFSPNRNFLFLFASQTVIAFIGVLWVMYGLAKLDRFVSGLEQILSQKVSVNDGEPVTFEDLKKSDCLPLRIVASNISDGKEEVFSAETSPNISVAEAVAASVCVPFVFRVRTIDEKCYFDGGLVSNLPAWVFDEERMLDSEAMTATIEVSAEPANEVGVKKGFYAIKSAISTAFFGRATLEKRAVPNLHGIRLEPSVRMLDFDMSVDLARAEIELATTECTLRLLTQIVSIPAQMEEICEQISGDALEIINEWRVIEGSQPLSEPPRVAILRPPMGTTNTLKIDYSHGFMGFTDSGISLPIDSSIAGFALTKDKPFFANRGHDDWNASLHRPQDRALKHRIRDELEWILAIPFTHLGVGEKRLILALDGQQSLCEDRATLTELLQELSFEVRNLLQEFVPVEVFQDGN